MTLIKYELDPEDGRMCITDCPHGINANNKIVKVGSLKCAMCLWFEDYDEDNHTVKCNFTGQLHRKGVSDVD